MLISSVTIGGVEFVTSTLIDGFTVVNDIGDRIGTASFSIFAKPADVASLLAVGAEVQIWGGTGSGSSGGAGFGSILFGQALFGGGSVDTSNRLFFGVISRVEPIAITVDTAGSGYTRYNISARDYGYLLDNAVIDADLLFENQTDQSIIGTLFTNYLPAVTVNAGTVATLTSIAFSNISIRQALQQIVDLTGAEFYLDANKTLQYHAPAAVAAPFGVSETADQSTTFFAEAQDFRYSKDFSTPANRVTVIGKLGDGGVAITATVDDSGSQTTYGLLQRTVVDRNIQTTAEATDRGNVEISRFSTPTDSGAFSIRTDGLRVGQLVPVTTQALGISGSFVIRKVTMTWDTESDTKYGVEFGAYRPDLYRLIRKLADSAAQPAYPPVAIPPPLTVTAGHLAATIEAVQIVNTLPALPDPAYTANAVVLLSTDRKIYRRNGNTWTAVVSATDISGSITSTQIADDSISTPKLQANAVTAAKVAALAITAGKIAADAVTAGTVAAGAISAADAAFQTAAIQSADIASLSASKLTAGTIDASSITVINLNASNITAGTLNVAVIANASITGAKIANATLTGANIVDASITSAKIASLSADKITAGTISAVTINSVSINGGSISGTSLSLNANGVTTTVANNAIVISGHGFAGIVTKENASNQQIGLSYNALMALNASGNISFLVAGGSSPGFYAFSSFPSVGVSLDPLNGLQLGNFQANCGSVQITGSTVINSSRQFVGGGVDVGGNGISCGNYNLQGGFIGVTHTFTASFFNSMVFRGGILVGYSA